MQSRDLKLTLEQIPNLRPHRRGRSFVSSRSKATPCLVPWFASGMFSEEPSRRGIRPPQSRGDREGSQEGGPCSQYAPESALNWDTLLCNTGTRGVLTIPTRSAEDSAPPLRGFLYVSRGARTITYPRCSSRL